MKNDQTLSVKKIFVQLTREFWIPLAIAIGWTVYGLLGQPLKEWISSKTINAAFVIFFGCSFWFGQWNRVKKQLRVEEGLTGIEGKAAKMLDDLDKKTKTLVSHITGGDAFCYGYPTMIQPDRILWTFIHSGAFPLYDLQVRIYDMRKPVLTASKTLNLGTLFPGRAHTYGALPGAIEIRTPVQAFNLFFVARNGSWTQEIRWVEMPGVLATANRVLRDGMPISEPLFCEISPQYPGPTPSDDAWKSPPGLESLN